MAQVVNHVVFADPTNPQARGLQAQALEQLGYQSESATWRNAYLMGAKELREGSPDGGRIPTRDMSGAMTAEHHRPDAVDPNATAAVRIDRSTLVATFDDVEALDRAEISGNRELVRALLSSLTVFTTATLIEP